MTGVSLYRRRERRGAVGDRRGGPVLAGQRGRRRALGEVARAVRRPAAACAADAGRAPRGVGALGAGAPARGAPDRARGPRRLLDTTYRMHPALTAFVSDLAYEGRLESAPDRQRIAIDGWASGLAVRFVEHTRASAASSDEEAATVAPHRDRSRLGGRRPDRRHGELPRPGLLPCSRIRHRRSSGHGVRVGPAHAPRRRRCHARPRSCRSVLSNEAEAHPRWPDIVGTSATASAGVVS
ncbi:MAG: putative RecB family nuclease [Modestobacter sp.]|nr:putative RecB family nuclease [Modestobacter sp.]